MAGHDEPVIVVGAGLAGLATALGAALNGRRAIVFESADKVGGAAAYSGGQVWVPANHVAARDGIDDDLDRAERYVRDIAHDRPELLDEDAMRTWLHTAPVAAKHWEDAGAIEWTVIPGLTDYHADADGALGVGRYLTNAHFDGSRLGAWRERLRVSPHFPVGTSYDEIMAKGRRQALLDRVDDGSDPLTFGTGVVASFLERVLAEDAIEIRTGHRVATLLQNDDGAVVGVSADGPDGPVEARGPVVLATSSYDWDPDLVREFLGLEPEDFGSVAPTSLKGDGIHLARSVGADVAVLPATRVPMLPGWPSEGEPGYTYGPEYALPHAITVDRSGRRFCDDSYYIDLIAQVLGAPGEHIPFFMIWDSEHHRDYGLGDTPPGGDYPEMVTSAPTLRELGERLGIDGEELERTAARYNEHAADGEDPEFGRGTNRFVTKYAGDPAHEPNALVGPVAEAPFHGMKLTVVGTGIGSSGVRIDGEGHVLSAEGGPRIEGLYAVGSCAALTSSGSGYNSGFALGRGLTLAFLVSNELGGVPAQTAATARPAG